MKYKQFYYFTFAFFLSLNVLVYLAKSGHSVFYFIFPAFIAFVLAYFFAKLAFRKIGWRKHES